MAQGKKFYSIPSSMGETSKKDFLYLASIDIASELNSYMQNMNTQIYQSFNANLGMNGEYQINIVSKTPSTNTYIQPGVYTRELDMPYMPRPLAYIRDNRVNMIRDQKIIGVLYDVEMYNTDVVEAPFQWTAGHCVVFDGEVASLGFSMQWSEHCNAHVVHWDTKNGSHVSPHVCFITTASYMEVSDSGDQVSYSVEGKFYISDKKEDKC